MAKNKTEIHVTTVFDGELDATDVFVSLISQKYGKINTKEMCIRDRWKLTQPCNSGFLLPFFPLADRRSHFL